MSGQTLNVGIIGFGFIGKVHAYAYQTLPFYYPHLAGKFRVTHVCTSRLETAELGRKMVQADVATTDSRAVTEDPRVDIVHICTPNHLHKDALLSAMRAGKHIYCDKPLTATFAECDAVLDALKSHRGISQMTFQNRFYPATMRARQLIDGGFLGRLFEFRSAYLHAGSADPDAPLKWKLSAESGGGVIADLASHVLDLMHHLAGDLSSLSAASLIAYPDRPTVDDPARRITVDAEDSAMILARTASGALGHIDATKIATGTEDEMRFELHGSDGAIRFNSMAPHFLEVFDTRADSTPLGGVQGWTRIHTGQRYPEPAAPFPAPKNSIGWVRSHVACLANFLEALIEGRPAQPDIGQGIYIQYLIEQTRRAIAEKAWLECKSRNAVLGSLTA